MAHIHHNGVLQVKTENTPNWCVESHTATVSDRRPMALRLKELRELRGMTQGSLAAAIGEKNYQTLQKIEQGKRRLDLVRAKRIAHVLGCRVSDLDDELDESGGTVPIVGYVGAGSEVRNFDDVGELDRSDDYGLPGSVALVVRGDSMWPAYDDGDLIYYYPDKRSEPDAVLKKPVVVQLRDGRTLLKRIYPGTKPGTYRLESSNAPPLEDVEVEWVAKVLNIHKG